MATNPTPFVLAQDAKWRDLPCGGKFLPARVYLAEKTIPAVVVKPRKRHCRIIIGDSPASGFGGLMLDARGKYAGSIRKSITVRGK